jgi:maleylpyruvate isomerase
LGTVDLVHSDPLALMIEVDRATGRLLDTAGRLDDAGVAGPSLLPGWTRGHVLAHIARNADGLTNLLTWARTGIRTPQYPSWQSRNDDIEAGAGRPASTHADDLRAAVDRFAGAAAEMTPAAWAVVLDTENPQPAARIPWRRLREVEVHHVDLAAGYGPADWPDAFSHRLLHEVCAHLRERPEASPLLVHAADLGHDLAIGEPAGAPTVTGPAYALAGWLTGRTEGDGLSITPTGPLPTLPDWI